MYARQGMLASEMFGDDLTKVFPIIQEDGSDSTKFDNCLEFLALSGRSLPHAIMMMIPEPWENHESMDAKKRAFYDFHACLMEPWDGPASIAFTDGTVVGRRARSQRSAAVTLLRDKDDWSSWRRRWACIDVPPERGIGKMRGCNGPDDFWSTPARGASSATKRSSRKWPRPNRTANG